MATQQVMGQTWSMSILQFLEVVREGDKEEKANRTTQGRQDLRPGETWVISHIKDGNPYIRRNVEIH